MADSRIDSDNDGLTDAEEQALGSDPNKQDTDGDGRIDAVDAEPTVAQASDGVAFYRRDSDGDGITDLNEVQGFRTDPLNADTDGDGVSDSAEFERGSNPVHPTVANWSWDDQDGDGRSREMEAAAGTSDSDADVTYTIDGNEVTEQEWVREKYERTEGSRDVLADASVRQLWGVESTPEETDQTKAAIDTALASDSISQQMRGATIDQDVFGTPIPQDIKDAYDQMVADRTAAIQNSDLEAYKRWQEAEGSPATEEQIAQFEAAGGLPVLAAARFSELSGITTPEGAAPTRLDERLTQFTNDMQLAENGDLAAKDRIAAQMWQQTPQQQVAGTPQQPGAPLQQQEFGLPQQPGTPQQQQQEQSPSSPNDQNQEQGSPGAPEQPVGGQFDDVGGGGGFGVPDPFGGIGDGSAPQDVADTSPQDTVPQNGAPSSPDSGNDSLPEGSGGDFTADDPQAVDGEGMTFSSGGAVPLGGGDNGYYMPDGTFAVVGADGSLDLYENGTAHASGAEPYKSGTISGDTVTWEDGSASSFVLASTTAAPEEDTDTSGEGGEGAEGTEGTEGTDSDGEGDGDEGDGEESDEDDADAPTAETGETDEGTTTTGYTPADEGSGGFVDVEAGLRQASVNFWSNRTPTNDPDGDSSGGGGDGGSLLIDRLNDGVTDPAPDDDGSSETGTINIFNKAGPEFGPDGEETGIGTLNPDVVNGGLFREGDSLTAELSTARIGSLSSAELDDDDFDAADQGDGALFDPDL